MDELTKNVHVTKRINHVIVKDTRLLRVESCAAEVVGKLSGVDAAAAVTCRHAALLGQKGGCPWLNVCATLSSSNETRTRLMKGEAP